MNIDRWLANALADADRRGLPQLKPLLESLAQATRIVRAADDARRDFPPPDAGRPKTSGAS